MQAGQLSRAGPPEPSTKFDAPGNEGEHDSVWKVLEIQDQTFLRTESVVNQSVRSQRYDLLGNLQETLRFLVTKTSTTDLKGFRNSGPNVFPR